jgi:hypothetical protein
MVVALARRVEKAHKLETGSLIGKAYIHFAEAAKRWDDSRGSRFSTFAYANAAKSLPRDAIRDRAKWASGDGGSKNDDSRRPERDHDDRPVDISHLDWSSIWDRLTSDQQEAVRLVGHGHPLRRVAEIMWKTKEEVAAMLKSAVAMIDGD